MGTIIFYPYCKFHDLTPQGEIIWGKKYKNVVFLKDPLLLGKDFHKVVYCYDNQGMV